MMLFWAILGYGFTGSVTRPLLSMVIAVVPPEDLIVPVLTLSVIKVLISYSYGAISKYNTDEGEPVWSALDDLFLYKVPVFVRP